METLSACTKKEIQNMTVFTISCPLKLSLQTFEFRI